MRRGLRILHKYLSLTVAALWLLQAVTGLLLVFHWELDDWGLAGPARALDPASFGDALERLKADHPRQTLAGVYPSGGLAGRFDVLLSDSTGATDVVRIDGAGALLRQRPWNHDFLHIGWLQIATYLHQTLFLHTTGNWIMGFSGLLLMTNISFGLSLAWPRPGQWLRTLTPPRSGPLVTRLWGWHRAVGLGLAIPALLLVCAGVIRAYDDPFAEYFENTRPDPPAEQAGHEPLLASVSIAAVLRTALQLYPGATLAALEFPDAHSPWFKVRLNQPHDLRRTSGTTAVYISSRSARVLANYDYRALPAKTRVWDAVYPLHTGEIGGAAGRCLTALVALWLITMIALGLSLWWKRRARPAARASAAQAR